MLFCLFVPTMAIKFKKWKWLWRGVKKEESRWTLPLFGNLFCYLSLFQLLTKSLMNLESSHVSLRDHSMRFNIENIFRVFGDCGANFVFLNQINKNSRRGLGEGKIPGRAITWWQHGLISLVTVRDVCSLKVTLETDTHVFPSQNICSGLLPSPMCLRSKKP